MKYLLDTDHLSIIQRRSSPEYGSILAHLAVHPPSDIALSIVSFHEQALGCQAYLAHAKTSADAIKGYQMLSRVIQDFGSQIVLPFDSAAAAVFDQFVGAKIRVATMDLRIAAIAIASGLILITRNAKHFQKIPGLTIEDWTI